MLLLRSWGHVQLEKYTGATYVLRQVDHIAHRHFQAASRPLNTSAVARAKCCLGLMTSADRYHTYVLAMNLFQYENRAYARVITGTVVTVAL